MALLGLFARRIPARRALSNNPLALLPEQKGPPDRSLSDSPGFGMFHPPDGQWPTDRCPSVMLVSCRTQVC